MAWITSDYSTEWNMKMQKHNMLITHTQTSELQLLQTMNQQIYKDKPTYMDREKHPYHFMHY